MLKKDKSNMQSTIEKIGKKIPDPVIIFIIFYGITFLLTIILGGFQFETVGPDGNTIVYEINNMLKAENIQWIFDNALLNNWLAYGGGVLGIILIVMLGIGIAEDSGLLATLIKKTGSKVPEALLPVVLVFLGIMSSIATDAGYIVLVPLAGLLYLGIGKNPMIGMAAAFAGVSAGFSANLLPGTPVDVLVGTNAQIFAENAGVPFESIKGTALQPATMHYYFIFISTFLLTAVGAFVTVKFVKPKLEKQSYIVPEDIDVSDFNVKPEENKALKWAGIGLLLALVFATILLIGPLAPFIDETGSKVNPFLNNIILIITFVFFMPGLFYGYKVGKFKNSRDVVKAMSKQMGSMGYIIVLTFFCYNFLSLLTYSGIGTFITYLGAKGLESMGLNDYPLLLIFGFIITTAIINLFVGGLTSKWMLLGPIFVPMLYQANSAMTPDIVAAAYRVADSSTNVISPMMTYAGVVLVFMRKYKPEYSLGDMIGLMMPYSIAFLISWTILLFSFFAFQIPLGF